MSTVSTDGRARPLRRITATLAALLVGLVGFVAAPTASAATAVTLTGIGAETSTPVSVSAGIYRVQLSYADNVGESGAATSFVAGLETSSGTMIETLADDVASSTTRLRIVEFTKTTELQVGVRVAAVYASWQVSMTRLAEPSATSPSLSVTGTSSNSAGLYRLKARTYLARVTWNGNERGGEPAAFRLTLRGSGKTSQVLAQGEAIDGAVIVNVRIATTGSHWLDAVATKDAHWSLSLTPTVELTATPTPRISGTAKVGRTLTAKPGTWKPSGVKLSYQWYRGTSKISGATKSSYPLTSKEKGKTVKVKVTGSKSGYLSVANTSKATSKVK